MELLDGAEEDEVGGAGAEGGADFWEVLFEGSVLEGDAGGEAVDVFLGGGVTLAVRHGFDGGEDEGVGVLRGRGGGGRGDLGAGGEDKQEGEKESHGVEFK